MPSPPRAIDATPSAHLFAYGSLVDPHCLEEVLGHPHAGERLAARLSGFQRMNSDSYPYPFLMPAADRCVQGVLIMDLTPYDLDVLDRYEDVDIGTYARQVVEVDAWSCGPQPMRLGAYTYVGGPGLIVSTAS